MLFANLNWKDMASNTWEVKFDSQRRLLGPYPKSIDLAELPMPEMDFANPSKIVIENDENLEELTILGDMTGVAFAEIESLSALKTLRVSCAAKKPYFQTLQWINLQDLGALNKIVVQGGVKALNISNAPMLKELDVSGCPSLELLSVEGDTSLTLIKLEGCVKLRAVHGLAAGSFAALQASTQITANQVGTSESNGLYENMTFTDVDKILDLINRGLKQASLKGMLPDWSGETGLYGDSASDPNFMPLGYRLLAPLEEVYTGGTGETYAFSATLRYGDLDDSVVDEVGNLSVEKCIEYLLQAASQFEWSIAGDNYITEESVLSQLTKLAPSGHCDPA